ncbi:MAG: peptide chain release factor N(5)-glutamine methyltransferase, partial [Pseudomonadota bacterium]
MSETYGAAIADASMKLADAGVPSPERDAELLMRWAAKATPEAFSLMRGELIANEAAARFETALGQRIAREPVSHITGERLFWGRAFKVTPDVLDPRPESEAMIAAALDGPEPERVLDLGVGSGCLLGTVLAERSEATGLGLDASRKALRVANENLEALGVSDRATLKMGDWIDGLEEGFNLILCNPPYIAEDELADLSPEVREHEPRLALTPGGDGMDPYRRIAPELAFCLRRKGRALFEIG